MRIGYKVDRKRVQNYNSSGTPPILCLWVTATFKKGPHVPQTHSNAPLLEVLLFFRLLNFSRSFASVSVHSLSKCSFFFFLQMFPSGSETQKGHRVTSISPSNPLSFLGGDLCYQFLVNVFLQRSSLNVTFIVKGGKKSCN